MRPKKLQVPESFTTAARGDAPPAPFEREGTVSVDGGPPSPADFSGQYVEGRRLRVFDLNLPLLFWLTIFWRGWIDGGEPALTISLWKPSKRRRWLHVWQWETDPDASGIAVTIKTTSPPVEERAAATPYCDYCDWLRQAAVRGECPQCGHINLD